MPAAEVEITTGSIRHLLRTQARETLGDAVDDPLRKVAQGWDNEVWRLGEAFAVRLPRRGLAAPLIVNEQRVLPTLAALLAGSGLSLPVPVVAGRPDDTFLWHWSVVAWADGDRGLDIPRARRRGWARPLAHALRALHVPAPADHPVNPVRGVPLVQRDAAFRERLDGLIAVQALTGPTVQTLTAHWDAGLRASAWPGRPVWIHGDLHPGNLVASGPVLRGVIDFGDVTAGDPAYDLAVGWLAFDADGRRDFDRALDGAYDRATLVRAKAWASAVAVILLAHSDDNPDYARLGTETAEELGADSPTWPAG
ncbi:aminoglycoside phosphotransferase family protein [Microbacterium terrae]|uniref:Phosphotransferase enzyme family protein n=1 Tax=Microbacterium terrae TaxID=69369 RepID=A0A0M2H3M3_9MICO|nr:aminoglycoside phosphotransferase family protein [Microbacterium terrae]KJL38955.1 Phosphotransferase enzyme family protein [Microbacterium terrae]GLJ99699.1 hypothetical protein GCM10017594_28970 [Microbacterium terrae]